MKCCGNARANAKLAATAKAMSKAKAATAKAKADANKHVWDPKTQTHTKPTTKKAPAKKHAKTRSAPPCKLCGAAAKRAAMLKAKKR